MIWPGQVSHLSGVCSSMAHERGALARVFGAFLCLRSQAEALRSKSPKKMGSVRSENPRTYGYTHGNRADAVFIAHRDRIH